MKRLDNFQNLCFTLHLMFVVVTMEKDQLLTFHPYDVDLCQDKCLTSGFCKRFVYKGKTLTCDLSCQVLKPQKTDGFTIFNVDCRVPNGNCSSEVVYPAMRCLKTRSGKYLWIQENVTGNNTEVMPIGDELQNQNRNPWIPFGMDDSILGDDELHNKNRNPWLLFDEDPQADVNSTRSDNGTTKVNGSVTVKAKGSGTEPKRDSITANPNNSVTMEGKGNVTVTPKDSIQANANDSLTGKAQKVTAKPTGSVTTKAKDSVTSKPKDSVTSKPKHGVTSKPKGNSVTAKPTGIVTTKPKDSVTSKPKDSATAKPTGSVTTKPKHSVTTKPKGNSVTAKPKGIRKAKLNNIAKRKRKDSAKTKRKGTRTAKRKGTRTAKRKGSVKSEKRLTSKVGSVANCQKGEFRCGSESFQHCGHRWKWVKSQGTCIKSTWKKTDEDKNHGNDEEFRVSITAKYIGNRGRQSIDLDFTDQPCLHFGVDMRSGYIAFAMRYFNDYGQAVQTNILTQRRYPFRTNMEYTVDITVQNGLYKAFVNGEMSLNTRASFPWSGPLRLRVDTFNYNLIPREIMIRKRAQKPIFPHKLIEQFNMY